MEQHRYALVDPEGYVENVVMLTRLECGSPSPGYFFIQSETAQIGDAWDGRIFILPSPSR